MSLSIRQRVLGAFSVDLILMLLLGFFALSQMASMGRQASRMEETTIPAIRNVEQLQEAVSSYRALQLEFMVHANSSDRQRLHSSMAQAEKRMAELIARHRQLTGEDAGASADDSESREASEALRAFEALWEIYERANRQDFLPAIRRSNTGTVQPAFSRLNPAYARLTAALNDLARLDELAAQRAMEEVGATHRESRVFILTDTALSILISAIVGLALASTLSRRIGRLSSATRRVAEGDLDQRVRDPRGDELSRLADNFNGMVSSLRRQRAALEQQNDELQASLTRQRGLTEDLVRRKEAEEAAYRARAEAEARDSAKSVFLATMSHELRTPLNAMLGLAQLMHLEAKARGDARIIDDLQRLDGAGKHLLTVINNLLDFSKIEQGKIELEVLDFEVTGLVQEVVAVAEPLAAEGSNTLHFSAPIGGLGTMRSDPGKLRQILFNLLSNALKFTENGEVHVEVLATEGAGAPETPPAVGHGFLFRIRDTGIGIEEEHLEIIFEPFRQAESSTTRRFGGTGLGLVVSRQLCQLLGGEIAVESSPGSGSTFTVALPASLSHPEDSQAA